MSCRILQPQEICVLVVFVFFNVIVGYLTDAVASIRRHRRVRQHLSQSFFQTHNLKEKSCDFSRKVST